MIQLDDHIFQVGWKIIDSKGPILSSSKIGPVFWSAGGRRRRTGGPGHVFRKEKWRQGGTYTVSI